MKLKNQHDHAAAKKQQPKMTKINQKTDLSKTPKKQKHPSRKTRTQNRTNPKNAGTRDTLDRKKGSSPNTKTTIEQQIRNNNKESLLPPNRFQGYLITIRSMDKRNPPKN